MTIICLVLLLTATPGLAQASHAPDQQAQQLALQDFERGYRSKHPGPRAQAVRGLEGMDLPWRVDRLVEVLRREATSRELEDQAVVAAAVEVLAGCRTTDSVRALMQAIVQERRPEVRAALLDALGGVELEGGDEGALPWEAVDRVLTRSLASRRPLDVLAALDCLGALRRADVLDRITPLLTHRDWRIRHAAVAAVAGCFDRQAPAGIGELVDRLPEERGRLQAELRASLERMTGWGCGRDDDCWRERWLAFQQGQPIPEPPAEGANDPAGAGGAPEFFGFEIVSKRVLILVDVSSSMLERYAGPGYVPADDRAQNPRGFAAPGELSKWDVAREELGAAIEHLREDQSFTIFFFGDDTLRWQPRLVPATRTWKRKALERLDQAFPGSETMTNFWAALAEGFELAVDKPAAGPDTFIFFTDGMPTVGKVSLASPDESREGQKLSPEACYHRIADVFARRNRSCRVAINTIGIGQHASSLLRRLAEDSGGQYRVAEDVLAARATLRKKESR